MALESHKTKVYESSADAALSLAQIAEVLVLRGVDQAGAQFHWHVVKSERGVPDA